MELGTKIRILRKSKQLTLKNLSEKIDLSISYLSDIENNRKNPSLDRLKDIAVGLEASINDLISEESTPYSTAKKEMDIPIQRIIELLNDEESREIMLLQLDMKKWSKKDKQELLTYLKIKQDIFKYNTK